MLGEAFLQLLPYRRDNTETTAHQDGHSPAGPDPGAWARVDPRTPGSPLTPRAVTGVSMGSWWEVGRQEAREQPGPRLTSAPSSALNIPSGLSDNYGGLELYRSWCCPTLCRDYPDLQLAGDQLGDRSSQSPRWESPRADGPLLQSEDLGFMETLSEPHQQNDPPAQQDKGYMEMENSMGGWERLSSSMLNGYLETKLLEVYCQHMQDSLARCSSSLGAAVMPTLVPARLEVPDGQADTQEECLDSTSTQNSVRYLSTCSAPVTSHFSSPELRISQPSASGQKLQLPAAQGQTLNSQHTKACIAPANLKASGQPS
ncbi:uncharacterized protein CXorf21 homolog [Chanos chanos]|uniref:Uncharacterized protein CXorf21 homolog n=1 Tax=Chanos chanos TaxID=29144 RepID=A0A6J2WV49_CHACN|nr:uncharacterized protein CXorf21 homolog [Chanos chanos]